MAYNAEEITNNTKAFKETLHFIANKKKVDFILAFMRKRIKQKK